MFVECTCPPLTVSENDFPITAVSRSKFVLTLSGLSPRFSPRFIDARCASVETPPSLVEKRCAVPSLSEYSYTTPFSAFFLKNKSPLPYYLPPSRCIRTSVPLNSKTVNSPNSREKMRSPYFAFISSDVRFVLIIIGFPDITLLFISE